MIGLLDVTAYLGPLLVA